MPNRAYLSRRLRHRRSWQHANQQAQLPPELVLIGFILFILSILLIIPILTVSLLIKFLEDVIRTLRITKDIITTDCTVSTLLRCITSTACCLFDAVLLYLWLLMGMLAIYGRDISADVYHQFLSSSFFKDVNITVQSAVKLSIEACSLFEIIIYHMVSGIYKFIVLLYLQFIETVRHEINKIPSYATSIGSWFLGNIYHVVILLDAHFPGGIIGFGILLLVAIVVEIFVQQFYKQSTEYTMCLQDTQQLQRKIEAIEIQLKEESYKLEQKTQHSQKLKQDIERLQQECDKLELSNLDFQKEKDEKLCVICQDQPKTILLWPCQHMCLCKQCLDHKKWKKCPICRQLVKSTMEVYI